jgi:hypothetical protein
MDVIMLDTWRMGMTIVGNSGWEISDMHDIGYNFTIYNLTQLCENIINKI